MSHLTCPKCKSTDHTQGYGLAAGPMGAYTFCNSCDELIDFTPDLDGLEGTEAYAQIVEGLDKRMTELWGDKWDTVSHRLKPEAFNASAFAPRTIQCDCVNKQILQSECRYPDCATFNNIPVRVQPEDGNPF